MGSLLSVELIKRGDKVIFFGRSKNGESFQKRIENKLKSIEPDISLKNTEIIEVDLHKENLGLSDDFIKQFSGKIDAIWHLAANLSFRKKDKEEIFATNINGLKNILNLTSRIKTTVYYMGTAYVHGQRPGVIFEDELIKPNCFNNPYEESKFESKKIIKEWGAKKENKFIIFRPSIFIDVNLKALTFFGYYVVVYALYKMRQNVKKEQMRIFFPFFYSKIAFLNLMPIDIAIKWMLKISSNSKALGRTFHIANPLPFSMKEITIQTFNALNIKIPVFGVPKWFIKLCFSFLYYISFIIKSIRGFAKKLYYYKYYMTEYNTYDMKNTKEIIGQDIVNQFNFPPDFIQNIAREFIKKLDNKNK